MAKECKAVRDESAIQLQIDALGGPLFSGWPAERIERFRAVARFQFSDGPDDFTSLINAARELLPQVMRPAAAPCILNDTMLSPNTPFPDLNRAALSFVVAYLLVVFEPAIRQWEAAEHAD